jgi:hypothetical protein
VRHAPASFVRATARVAIMAVRHRAIVRHRAEKQVIRLCMRLANTAYDHMHSLADTCAIWSSGPFASLCKDLHIAGHMFCKRSDQLIQ